MARPAYVERIGRAKSALVLHQPRPRRALRRRRCAHCGNRWGTHGCRERRRAWATITELADERDRQWVTIAPYYTTPTEAHDLVRLAPDQSDPRPIGTRS
jgi:hypothetical protein